jgi:hypothetical protein
MRVIKISLLILMCALATLAHVGSPAVYLDTKAGPYELFFTVQPPAVIPGVAEIGIRVKSEGIRAIDAAPLQMTGPGSTYAPVPETLKRSKTDAQYFTGSIWLMRTGSSQIRFTIHGDEGQVVTSLPLPAIAQRTKTMQASLGGLLFGLMSLLVVGLVSIAGAAVREAPLEAGVQPRQQQIRKGRIAMAAVFVLLIAVIALGDRWWNSAAGDYSKSVYKPLLMQANRKGGSLQLTIRDPGWLTWRKVDDFILDHDHLMHLYAIREPEMDIVFHLHPEMKGSGLFKLQLPDMPAGRYRLYADVVHEDGFAETMSSTLDVPGISGVPLQGDDAVGKGRPLAEVSTTTHPFHVARRLSNGVGEWPRSAPAEATDDIRI